jgi:hypothetical protein
MLLPPRDDRRACHTLLHELTLIPHSGTFYAAACVSENFQGFSMIDIDACAFQYLESCMKVIGAGGCSMV